MLLYVMRHGETDWNRFGKLQGRADIPLNEKGIALAEESAKGMRDIYFDRVISSPLLRARKTAEIISEGREIPFTVDERIQEISFGSYEGKRYMPKQGIIDAPEMENFFEHPELYKHSPDGESLAELIARTGEFLQELVHTKEYEEETILVVCHGAALRAVLANVKGVSLENFWGRGVHKNCGVSILEAHEGKITILEEGKIFYKE